MNFNPAFFHLVKSPYWWQLYLCWVIVALLSVIFFKVDHEIMGSALAFCGTSSYSFFCFGILHIKRFRNKFVRYGAYWNRYHVLSLNLYALNFAIASLFFLVSVLVSSITQG